MNMNRSDSDWDQELTEAPLGWGGFSEKSIRRIKERVEHLDKKKRNYRALAASLLVLTLLSSSLLFQGPIKNWINKQETSKQTLIETWEDEDLELTVQYWDTDSFMNNIGRPFVIRHPSIQFKVAQYTDNSDSDAAVYMQWIREQKPDVLQVPLALVDDLAEAGIIKPLDDWIAKDNYPLQDFYQPVIRTLREAGAGMLYGLTPYFETPALYYNKTLFDHFGLTPPHNQMSWNEVLQLASRFNGTNGEGKPIYGLATHSRTSSFQLLLSIGDTEGLQINDSNLQPTLNTASWRELWEDIARGYQEGYISNEATPSIQGEYLMSDLYKSDPFLTGRAALAYKSSDFQWDINQAKQSIGFNDEWGVVTQPVNPNYPDQARQFTLSTVYAINAESTRQEAAWALIQYIMSPEKAKRDSANGNSPLLSRTPSLEQTSLVHEDIFYKLEADSTNVLNKAELNLLPGYTSYYQALTTAGNQAMQSVIEGANTLDTAIDQLQLQAEQLAASMNVASNQAKENP
jgi:multiple sugar transport system substrate-binding protein